MEDKPQRQKSRETVPLKRCMAHGSLIEILKKIGPKSGTPVFFTTFFLEQKELYNLLYVGGGRVAPEVAGQRQIEALHSVHLHQAALPPVYKGHQLKGQPGELIYLNPKFLTFWNSKWGLDGDLRHHTPHLFSCANFWSLVLFTPLGTQFTEFCFHLF